MKGLSGSFLTNPHYKPPYWISVGIGAAYVMRPSWSLSCYIDPSLSLSFFPSPIDCLSSFGIICLQATRPVTLRSILSILYLSINRIIPRTGIRNQKPSIPSILHPPINGTIPQRELQTIGNRLTSVISLPRHWKPAGEYCIAAASLETGWRVLYRRRVIGNRPASIVSPPRHRKPASKGCIAAADTQKKKENGGSPYGRLPGRAKP